MADLAASNLLTIQSHRGPYAVAFDEPIVLPRLAARAHYLIDAKVARLYPAELEGCLDAGMIIEAAEENKSLEAMPRHVAELLARGVRRGDVLVAIGGGIIQDIACFLAATLLRGLDWHFVPTTLLAQADSCIGSKSSINAGTAKNALGTFTPPKSVAVCARFLDSLDERDVRSGIGEMLKVHAIDGPASFDRIASDYRRLFREKSVMLDYIRRSLEIKKRIIELDEFDRGPRNVMNYGHSFGHAIESATDFAVPHGIAVTLGMDMANFVAARLGVSGEAHCRRMHPTLAENYAGFEEWPVPLDRFFAALAKDKKNTAAQLGLVLLDAAGVPTRAFRACDEAFQAACGDFLSSERRR